MRILIGIVFFVQAITLRAQDTTRLSLIFAGDIMGHDSQIASAYDPVTKKYDYASCFQFMKPYLEPVDLAIGNLELTLAGPPYKGYPQFSSPDNLALTLKEVGFDVLVTANNHCVDRGKKGLERTVEMLDSFGIAHTGTFVDTVSRMNDYPLLVYKNGFTLAVLNYTYGTNGLPVYKPNIVNLIDTAMIRKDLLKAKASNPDAIIVFTHWGSEYQSLPSQAQKVVAEACFKHGAQLVIGAHPHVIQPMEWRKDKNQFVAYSLGNFVSGQRKRYTDGGSMAYVELQKISFAPDSAITTIDSAGYYLEWIYRTVDAKKDYYMLPVSKVENDSVSFIKDAASKEAFRVFAEDSRALYRKYNKHVNEITIVPPDSVEVYKVLLLETAPGEDPWKILTAQSAFTWGVEREEDPSGRILWVSGNFATRGQAERYRDKYITQHKEARVLRYLNGKRVE
jgi:poly-gamma-glutamate synthesis protein (capsule biosynthesis protein)